MDTPTRAQHKALALIRDNPRRVVAWLRGEKDLLTIHGNTENMLFDLKWIKEFGPIDTRSRMVVGQPAAYEVFVWELTVLGEQALTLGDHEYPAPGPDEPRLAKLKEMEVPFRVCVHGDGTAPQMNTSKGAGTMVTVVHLRKRSRDAIEGVTGDGRTVRFGVAASLIKVIPGDGRR